MSLVILTLTWQAEDKLKKLKESLMPALKGIDYKWIIKDNASSDNTVNMVKDWGNNIHVVPYKNNLQNFSEGMNYIFNEAAPDDDDMILCLNNDIIINDNKSISKMISIMDKDSSVGVVGAKLTYTNTDKLQHAGVVFNTMNHIPMHFKAKKQIDTDSCKNRLFQVVTGAVLLTKAKYYKNVCHSNKSGNKGMDESYHWAFDDVDMCLAINKNMDRKVVYCGETDIFHEESASLKKNPANRLFMQHNMNLLINKWHHRYIIDKNYYDKDPKYNLYFEESKKT